MSIIDGHKIRIIADFFWPTLECESAQQKKWADEAFQTELKAIETAPWTCEPSLAVEESRRLLESEEERFRTVEGKATTYILFTGALVPLLTYLESSIGDPKLSAAPKWLTIAMFLLAVAYLVRGGVWAFRAVQVGTYHRLDPSELLQIWEASDPQRRLIRKMLVCVRRNYEPINNKITSFILAHMFIKRALITFGFLLFVVVGWNFLAPGSVPGRLPAERQVAAQTEFVPQILEGGAIDRMFSMNALLCRTQNPLPLQTLRIVSLPCSSNL